MNIEPKLSLIKNQMDMLENSLEVSYKIDEQFLKVSSNMKDVLSAREDHLDKNSLLELFENIINNNDFSLEEKIKGFKKIISIIEKK